MTDYTKKMFQGTILVFIMSILAALIGYLLRFVLARNLTQTEFGLFYAAYAFVFFFSLFKDLGLRAALNKFIPEFEVKKRYDMIKSFIISVFILQTAFAAIITFLFLFFADYLSVHYFHNPVASFVVKVLAFAFLFSSVENLFESIFTGFQRMRYHSFMIFLKMFIILLITFIFIKLGYGISAPLLGYLITPFVTIIISYYIFTKKIFSGFYETKFFI